MIDIPSLYSKCSQCPHKCNVSRHDGKVGICGESEDIRVANACLHFGEEPLVTVFGGSGTIFFTGCTLHCQICQNYQISLQGMGSVIKKSDFVKLCLLLEENGAENINLVTASHIIPLLSDYLQAARNAGLQIPFCWNSSAYESVESLELLKDLVTIWLPDLKTFNSEVAEKLYGAKDYPEVAPKAIKWMIENNPLSISLKKKDGVEKEKIERGVIIRHLFLPGHFEDTCNVLDWLKKHADSKAIISLMSQYTPVSFTGTELQIQKQKEALSLIENRLVNNQEDSDIKDIIEAYDFDYLFYQELSTDTDWLPDFSKRQPFSNNLAKPFWNWKDGFLN